MEALAATLMDISLVFCIRQSPGSTKNVRQLLYLLCKLNPNARNLISFYDENNDIPVCISKKYKHI